LVDSNEISVESQESHVPPIAPTNSAMREGEGRERERGGRRGREGEREGTNQQRSVSEVVVFCERNVRCL
jgi:hypothetical protein